MSESENMKLGIFDTPASYIASFLVLLTLVFLLTAQDLWYPKKKTSINA